MTIDLSRRSLVLGAGGGLLAGGASLATTESAEASTIIMKIGSTGARVLHYQRVLTASGYWLGTPDGSFGLLTQQATYALQKAHGRARTGYVDQALWDSGLPKVRATSRLKLDGIEVDLAKQLLMVVRGGVVQVALNTSTGNGERFRYYNGWATAITPKGTFRVFRKSTTETSTNSWVTGPLGSMYKPRFFTSSGVAIHGSTSIPPYPASHGCCRLSTAAQDHLLGSGYLGIGTDVRIY
ncbi:L,D-transpeptidase family protein [Yimella sp. RIT 621]|uniref:L,D-transpeptidase family protein n=1 Tax=Yimella sp. RIT 621 TaxID=2510323 RepID=UPI001F0FC9FF|nr:L,D-transpeptidase family protein [Yimella sp. RIT 621]